MYRGAIVVRFVLAVILVAVLVAGGVLLYRSAWAQGYQAGSLVTSDEGAEALPMVPQFRGHLYAPFYPGFGFPFFGLCLSFGFIFLIMFLIGGIFRPWGRRRWAGHGHYGRWGYGADWEDMHRKWHDQEKAESKETSGDSPDNN